MRALLVLLLALALLPLALPTASATTCSASTTSPDPALAVQWEAGSKCLGVTATACAPGQACQTVYGSDLFPCFCPGPVPW